MSRQPDDMPTIDEYYNGYDRDDLLDELQSFMFSKSQLRTEIARLKQELEIEQTKTALLIKRCEDLQRNDTFSSSDYKINLHGSDGGGDE